MYKRSDGSTHVCTNASSDNIPYQRSDGGAKHTLAYSTTHQCTNIATVRVADTSTNALAYTSTVHAGTNLQPHHTSIVFPDVVSDASAINGGTFGDPNVCAYIHANIACAIPRPNKSADIVSFAHTHSVAHCGTLHTQPDIRTDNNL